MIFRRSHGKPYGLRKEFNPLAALGRQRLFSFSFRSLPGHRHRHSSGRSVSGLRHIARSKTKSGQGLSRRPPCRSYPPHRSRSHAPPGRYKRSHPAAWRETELRLQTGFADHCRQNGSASGSCAFLVSLNDSSTVVANGAGEAGYPVAGKIGQIAAPGIADNRDLAGVLHCIDRCLNIGKRSIRAGFLERECRVLGG